ncbi:MAG TPA: hypothetical protein VGJ95_05045 [Pseudonocardiaceae bacterium]
MSSTIWSRYTDNSAPPGYKGYHRRPGLFARLRQNLRRSEPADVYDRLGAMIADDPDSTIAIKLPPPSWTQDTLRIPGYVLAVA